MPEKGATRLSFRTVAAFLAVEFCHVACPCNRLTGTPRDLRQTSPLATALARKQTQTANVSEQIVSAVGQAVLQAVWQPARQGSTAHAALEAEAVTSGKFHGVDAGGTVVYSNDPMNFHLIYMI